MDHAERSYNAGRAEGTLEIARKMKEVGDSAEKIHTVTGLSFETIGQL
jgi:predicted transposase YdaD